MSERPPIRERPPAEQPRDDDSVNATLDPKGRGSLSVKGLRPLTATTFIVAGLIALVIVVAAKDPEFRAWHALGAVVIIVLAFKWIGKFANETFRPPSPPSKLSILT